MPATQTPTTDDTDPLKRYHLLGRTGLRVSPLALGAATFGDDTHGAFGADEETSRAMFRRYLEAGGNFINTADVYAAGNSEELLGTFIRETDSRDRLVVATKFSMATQPGNPNGGGNGRKHLLAALDGSLRRLQTDYVDLYLLHAWDTMTPMEEVLSTFDTVVRAGKARAVGLSNVPAWYAAKAQMLAQARGWEPVTALELEYSLITRQIEREHVPAALDGGMGVMAYAPLASGFLTGKYTRTAEGPTGPGRLDPVKALPRIPGNRDQDWDVLETLQRVAGELGRPASQVAVNWVAQRPGVAATLVGARTVTQLENNIAALEFSLSPEQQADLDAAGQLDLPQPYSLFAGELHRQAISGGLTVRAEPEWFRTQR